MLWAALCITAILPADVHFTPKNRHCGMQPGRPLCAKSGHFPRCLQGFQKRDEVAFLLVGETEIETLVVKFDDV
jgi:hypothetical protein